MKRDVLEVSIVTTLFNSATHLREFYERTSSAVSTITQDYEIILVNDGSPDDSLEIALSLFYRDFHVKVVDLSRNFGHHKAIITGLQQATGEKIFLIDCDLEEEPENLTKFFSYMKAHPECDVVYGRQPVRKGGFLSRNLARLFYAILNFFANERLDEKMVFSRLMTRRYVNSLLSFRERELFLVGLWHITGYQQHSIIIKTVYKGRSSYTFKKKVEMAITAITSFSDKPLIYISYLGLFISLLAGASMLYLLIQKFLLKHVLAGWTSVVLSIWFMCGLVLMSMGVVGLYISRIFMETKQRPLTIIKDLYSRDKEE